tara:strand:- start:120 stop:302 length:183 start_codon:yes stop_codon:yes gene_type:complete
MNNHHNFQENTKSELEFRVWFKNEFGVDYVVAKKQLEDEKAESERKWQQTIIKNNINMYM